MAKHDSRRCRRRPFITEDGHFYTRCWECLTFTQQHAVLSKIEDLAVFCDRAAPRFGSWRASDTRRLAAFQQAKARLRALILGCAIDEEDWHQAMRSHHYSVLV